ncbi:DUF4240 domain-containing protein [Undibacterium sp. Ji67W]|uniref:DUF4240 domain-containing protein n=1 Tax=Undibacterium sp. Ji67W TaxID=3413042 RepID=UPI003BF39F39
MNQDNNNEKNAVAKSFLAAMSSSEFWEVVQKCKRFDDPADGQENKLAKLQPQQVAAFKWHLENFVCAAYSWDMWGAAYMLRSGCSEDSFMNFLYGLVSQGKRRYEKAVHNPDSLAELWGQPDISSEDYCYVPRRVYAEMTGQEIPDNCWIVPGTLTGEYFSDTPIDAMCDELLARTQF